MMKNKGSKTPLETGRFPALENPEAGDRCHVLGWYRGAVFTVVAVEGDMVKIVAVKAQRYYAVRKDRLTKVNEEKGTIWTTRRV